MGSLDVSPGLRHQFFISVTSSWGCGSVRPGLVYCQAGARTSAQPWSSNPMSSHGHSPGRTRVPCTGQERMEYNRRAPVNSLLPLPKSSCSLHLGPGERRCSWPVPRLSAVRQCAGPSPATRIAGAASHFPGLGRGHGQADTGCTEQGPYPYVGA